MLSEKISNNEIDNLYNYYQSRWLGKNLGAGAGVFTFIYCQKNKEN